MESKRNERKIFKYKRNNIKKELIFKSLNFNSDNNNVNSYCYKFGNEYVYTMK